MRSSKMKEYQELKDWREDPAPVSGYSIDGFTLPPNENNRHYRLMMEEVDAGEAIILPAVEPPPPGITVVVKVHQLIIIDAEGVEHDVTQKLLEL